MEILPHGVSKVEEVGTTSGIEVVTLLPGRAEEGGCSRTEASCADNARREEVEE